MKKYGRFLIVYLAIVTLLYGTTNVMPVIVRKDRAYYTTPKGALNDPSGDLQTAGGSVEIGSYVEPPQFMSGPMRDVI